ncbi:MAG: hypothetical protein SCM57_09020 [Bacillota bacterium]|nr:hypothetical protein [Bacillota bacterium]
MPRLQKLIVIMMSLALLLLPAGCGPQVANQVPATEDAEPAGHFFEQVYENVSFNLAFSYPEQWQVMSEKVKDGVLTLTLEQVGGSASLVLTVLGGEMTEAELVKNGEELLARSLFQPRLPAERVKKQLSGRLVNFLATEAGERDRVSARTAVFAKDGNSHFLTLMAKPGAFPEANETLELIVSGMK